jgi:epoxyqueuosine reductase
MITSDDIKQLAARAGFDLCGITPAEPIPEAQARFEAWLDKRYQAEMVWLEKNRERRLDPGQLGIDAQSVIMLGLNYYQPNSEPAPAGHGRISRYARGRDYHKVIAKKIKHMLELITTRLPESVGAEFRWWVDFGPFMERAYGTTAGLGYLGKNGMLINRKLGSYFFLAEIVTSLELKPDDPQAINHGRCGSCTLCIDACPTDAIVGDGVIDSALCLSYWTIENPMKTPDSIASKIGLNMFGCDICQEVCPHKGRAQVTTHAELLPDAGVGEFLSIDRVLSIETRDEFLELTAGTPLTRPKLEGLQRIAQIMKASH